MTDSMNFGPDWIRNLSSEGNTAGGTGAGGRYQLADYRYGREEMLALFDKNLRPPASITQFKYLYSEPTLLPLALLPQTDEERLWQSRQANITGPTRGRGGSLERGGRVNRGRGGFQGYGRPTVGYDPNWANGAEQTDWSPRKEFNTRTQSVDNWRRTRVLEDDDGWRNVPGAAGAGGRGHEKWQRSTSWRDESEGEERGAPPERGGRGGWHDGRGPQGRRSWDNDGHLPEWATEHPTEGGGTFDERGAFHGSDDESLDGRSPNKREMGLQKSTSQQHISAKHPHPPLSSSKSAMVLSKPDGDRNIDDMEDNCNNAMDKDKNKSVPNIPDKIDKEHMLERAKSDDNPKLDHPPQNMMDFERMQEDLILKLVDNEEPLGKVMPNPNAFEMGGPVQPPPNLAPPVVEKWFYLDPQDQMQGPFANMEMAEWYKAGYFSHELKVRRHCDERFFHLGELITLCGGANPFQAPIRLPQLKTEIPNIPNPELLKFQFLQLQALKQQQQQVPRPVSEPWNPIPMQPQDLTAQQLMMQQQQANKIPAQPIIDKPGANIPNTIDPHLAQMILQNRHVPNNMPGARMASPLHMDMMSAGIPSLQQGMTPNVVPGRPIPGMNIPRPAAQDPLRKLLNQLQQTQPKMDSMWMQPNHFPNSPPAKFPGEVPPNSMWDMQQQMPVSPPLSQTDQGAAPLAHEKAAPPKPDKEPEPERPKEDPKEAKKRKELEEKQAKKEADEKRKQEQRKMEAEKRASEEKRRKEDDRIKRELEKAKKTAEEKRLKELEERRRLKEQRKAEEEARKKMEDTKKAEDEQRRREAKEQEERNKATEKRLAQEQIKQAKAAPWSQSSSTMGMSLAEIQKAEKEKRAQEAALQLQRQQILEQQLQLQQERNTSGIQLNWANKPTEPRKVKSFAEIQAEEQERLAKQAAEARLQKEKEQPAMTNTNSIWNNQNLTWANTAASGSQWSSNSPGGFWDELSHKQSAPTRPSTVPTKQASLSNAVTNNAKQSQAQQQPKQQVNKQSKQKKEDAPSKNNNNNNNNGPTSDEFMNWCYKSLSNLSTTVDIPTFVTFLRDIESAFDVREYCKEYLGDNNATQQFANNFLEKRRSFKPKANAHKDDMCSPAPAITPSSVQHSNDFQEVKGKNKKNKKSKMLKMDKSILGFHVTSAPDRINVGDRDYGDNS